LIVEAEVKVHDKTALPAPVTLVGDTLHEVLLVANATTLPNPFRAMTVREEVAAVPALTVMLVGLAVRVKSCTV